MLFVTRTLFEVAPEPLLLVLNFQLDPENPPLRKIARVFTANYAATNLIGFLASNTN
jgi:hypothetical protein